MRNEEKFFQPLMGSRLGINEKMPLDIYTPRGLFLGDSGNRYIVCDCVGFRAAVTLKHDSLPEFAPFELSSDPVDHGTPLGEGHIRLRSILLNDTEGAFLGTLLVKGCHIRILCNVDGLGFQWVNIAFGGGGLNETEYGRWTMKVGKEVFFSYDCRQREAEIPPM
ncbi:hypothetical protein ACOYW6_09795 [Parablastomonas sp. CN1-191]|uniref:hypothetical protein n=1 Tax=Parablastomonas sp. CN1-191 TaxID=3400908 RepID=UPI003BF85037